MSSYSSLDNLRKNEKYIEVKLLNNYKEILDKKYDEYNKNARAEKKADGFFINLEDGNIYLNDFMRNPYSYGWKAIKVFDYNSLENHLRFSNCALKNDWKDIYLHTKFLIRNKIEKVWFSFQFLPLDKKYFSRSFSIISAENPVMKKDTKIDNEKNNNKLKQLLDNEKYENYQTIATLGSHTENCFIIYDIQKSEAIGIGNEFNQESIVFFDKNELSIIKCSNSLNEISIVLNDFYKD